MAKKSDPKKSKAPAPKVVAKAKPGKARKPAAGKSDARAPQKAPPVVLGKSPLSKAQIKDLRAMLIQKRRALLGDLAGIEDQAIGKNRLEGSGDLSNMPTHPADVGSDNYEQEFTLGLLESERALLDEINQALERMDANTYGLCVGTGKPIAMARLKARPWAKYCIEYAKMLEKGLVRPPEKEQEERGDDAAAEDEEDDREEEQGEEDEAEEPEERHDEAEAEEDVE